jgi:hypothetical protein
MPLDPSPSSGQALAAALRRHLLRHFPADRAYPRAAFHTDAMPPLVASFLDRTLDRWVEEERARFRSDWFDLEDPNVQLTQRQFFAALRRTARVPPGFWEEMLGGAIDLVVRFLTMPARALTDAIFEGTTEPLSTTEVRARLSMFDAYLYLAEVASAYFDRKQPEALDPDALFVLLDRIDRRVVSEYGLDEWLDLLAPLFDLAGHVPELDGVPADRLQRFFEAKGEIALADRLAEHEGEVLDEAELRAVLAPAFPEPAAPEEAPEASKSAPPEPPALGPAPPDPPADDAAPPSEAPEALDTEQPGTGAPPPAAEPPASEAGTSPPETHPPANESADEDEGAAALPLWQRFAEHGSDGDSVNARFGAEDAPDAADDEAPVPLWKRFFSRDPEAVSDDDDAPPAPPSPEAPAPSPVAPARTGSLDALEKSVLGPTSSAQRKRFIKHLFGGDAGKYATVLHTLDGIGSWTEASQIIARDVFRPSRVNIYGEHAVAFTDAVESRFRG